MRLSFFICPSLYPYFKVFPVSPLIIFITGGRYNSLTPVWYIDFVFVGKKNKLLLYLLFILPYYLHKNNISMEKYKRKYRQLSDETKSKISVSSKNKPKSALHRQHIQQSMLRYWSTVGNKPTDLPMNDYLKGNDDN